MDKRKYVNRKMKTVDGFHLTAEAFAYVGDPHNPSTWKLPIIFRGDVKRTVNHIKNAISRFDEVKGIPATARQSTWLVIRGAALSHGLCVPDKSFATTPDEKAQAKVEDAAQVMTEQKTEEQAAIAQADEPTERMLRKLGLE